MNKKPKGLIGSILNILWALSVVSVLVAIAKVNDIKNVADAQRYIRHKSAEINACLQGDFENIYISCNLSLKAEFEKKSVEDTQSTNKATDTKESTTSLIESLGLENVGKNVFVPKVVDNEDLRGIMQLDSANVDTDKALNILNALEEEQEEDVSYNRNEWKHWEPFNEKKECWSVREEVLYRQAKEGSLIFLDRKGNETNKKSKACSIKQGIWIDPYSGKMYTKPSELDVDHHIPLKKANSLGGYKLSKREKKAFANDLNNLVVTSAEQNRSKSAKGPSEYLPPNEESHCAYAKIYVVMSGKYSIGITKEDKEVLHGILTSCK